MMKYSIKITWPSDKTVAKLDIPMTASEMDVLNLIDASLGIKRMTKEFGFVELMQILTNFEAGKVRGCEPPRLVLPEPKPGESDHGLSAKDAAELLKMVLKKAQGQLGLTDDIGESAEQEEAPEDVDPTKITVNVEGKDVTFHREDEYSPITVTGAINCTLPPGSDVEFNKLIALCEKSKFERIQVLIEVYLKPMSKLKL
jgi:hypothetical protein